MRPPAIAARLRGLLRPTFWITAERAFGELFFLGLFAIQAPILGPKAFGLVAVVMVFAAFWEAVPGHALTEALLSVREADDLHFSTATSLGALLCLGFGVAVFAAAEPLAHMFGDPELAAMTRVMSVLPLIQALSITPLAAAQRQMRFQSTTLRTIVSLLAGGGVGLGLALHGAGAWALVWQAIVQRSVATVVLWIAVPIPFGLAISRRHAGTLIAFAMPVSLARFMGWISGQFPRLVLGLFLGTTDLGLFSLAARFNAIVNQVVISPKATVARISLQRDADDPAALRHAARRVLLQISCVSYPVCIGGAVTIPTLFHAWLDARWSGAVVPCQLLLLSSLPAISQYVATAILLAAGRPRWEAATTTAQCTVLLLAMAVGAPFGLVAAAIAIALLSLAALPIPVLALRRTCGFTWTDVLLPQAAPAVAACLMGCGVLLLRRWLGATCPAAIALVACVTAGLLMYPVLLAVMMPGLAAQLRRRLAAASRSKVVLQ